MKTVALICALAAFALAACSCTVYTAAAPPGPAVPVLPDGTGVNIHFTDPKPGEMKMLAEGGFRWVRMDFAWGGTEREKGKYDFGPYDRLMAALEPHGIRALFILDYSNRLYDNDLSPCSDEGRKAMARWAAAAAAHFKGRGILWEMYNEPNISFWRPKPNVKDYVLLALEVGKALREAAPGEAYIGPATSGVDFTFLEECFKAGLLEYWSAVSVHPYRQEVPETAAADYARLRRLIGHYAPRGKTIPILSGEWGYSATWRDFDDAKQGKYLARQWLTNQANDVPLSIWYDWHDDGQDPKEPEHHFGTVNFAYNAGRDPVYDPKPAYMAAKTLTTVLGGFRFNKRLAVGGAEDHVLLFSKGDEVRLAAWTSAKDPHTVLLPASPGGFTATGHTGQALAGLAADKEGLKVTLTDAPQYLAHESQNDLLRLAAAWDRLPLEALWRPGSDRDFQVAYGNPLSRPVRIAVVPGAPVKVLAGARHSEAVAIGAGRSEEPQPIRVELDIDGMGRVAQEFTVVAANPLRVALLPPTGKTLAVGIDNPSGEALKGVIRLTEVEGLKPAAPGASFALKEGERSKVVSLPLLEDAAREYRLGLRVEDERGNLQVAVPAATFSLVDDLSRYGAEALAQAYEMVPDGDAKVASTQTVSVAAPPEGPPAPGAAAIKIAYKFDAGWKFARLVPRADALKRIEGRPKALGVWICGDGSGNMLRLRFTDSTGQTFQPGGEAVKWNGWRYVVFPMDGTRAGRWGGAGDGAVHYPIRWDCLLLVDSARRQPTSGEIYAAWPTLIR
jgi:hypothetical protein